MSVGLTVCPLSPDYSELAFLFLEVKNMSIIQGVGINNHRYPAFFNGKTVKEKIWDYFQHHNQPMMYINHLKRHYVERQLINGANK